MITVPSCVTTPHQRLYRDSPDSHLVYVDLLDAEPAHGDRATRWMPVSRSAAYLVGEVRFGPGPKGFGDVPAVVPGQRLLPTPWESGPVVAWYRQGQDVQVVARGKTSGFGPSNAVFNGTAPLAAMISPVVVAGALSCPARVAGAAVRGGAPSPAVRDALGRVAVGARAGWTVSFGEALVEMLTAMHSAGTLELAIAVPNAPAATVALRSGEMKDLALLEFAHRLAAVIAPALTLATPAAAVPAIDADAAPPLDIAWSDGASITLRAIRVLRPREQNVTAPHA